MPIPHSGGTIRPAAWSAFHGLSHGWTPFFEFGDDLIGDALIDWRPRPGAYAGQVHPQAGRDRWNV
jgi:hypothetical protein